MEEECIKIEIVKELPLFGEGDTLENRLRKVSLKGFPNVKIYENAKFELVHLTPEQIQNHIHTPQPSVYQTHLKKVKQLSQLFKEKGVDISKLDRAYDYIATSSNGTRTNWTMLPPVVERWQIPITQDGTLDYTSLIGQDLMSAMQVNGWQLSPDVKRIVHSVSTTHFDLINDGSHRIHYGVMNQGTSIIRISGMTPGFPYYAIPQPYSRVKVHEVRDESAIETKLHIITSPGHKSLYRLFPSGGIMSGDVRPEKGVALK